MSSIAEQGYGQVARQTASPRQIEFRLLTSIASQLDAADPSTVEGARKLAEAVYRNTELWSTLLVDITSTGNQLPNELKSGLLSLARYSVTTGPKVLSGEEKPQALSDVNRAVAQGLAAAAAASQAA